MRKNLLLIPCLLLALAVCAPAVFAQGGTKTGPDPSTIRDPEMEKDSLHNLEVARLYFKLKKAYVAALQRCEEIVAGNPNFARIDEVLFIAGSSSLYLAENKGKQPSSLYGTRDGNTKRTLTPEEFRELGRNYLTQLVNDYPQSTFIKQAEEALRVVGSPKTEKQ
jgi:outer membrane protein assembly factor BamD (BamD/ComL family)